MNESLQKTEQIKYTKQDAGFIKAWGGLLYLSYHNLESSGETQSDFSVKNAMIELCDLESDSEEYEDFQDWLVDGGYENGIPLWNKESLTQYFINISNKTISPIDIKVYRTSNLMEPGFNSYTTKPGSYHGNNDLETRSYIIPKGTPIIFASNIADKYEIIWNPSLSELNKYKIN
mgnify:CR=1 FL=1